MLLGCDELGCSWREIVKWLKQSWPPPCMSRLHSATVLSPVRYTVLMQCH
uniref:Uncharacterized protein n=1 Tax=Anguilla anguilla TaxID=7936 RepID=A0A0E9Q7K7_ANGAN